MLQLLLLSFLILGSKTQISHRFQISSESEDNNKWIDVKQETFAVAYEHAKFQGESLALLPRIWKGCHVLDKHWRNRISSVDVVGGCVDLCLDDQCEGPCRKICPGIRGENNLTTVNFDNNVNSFQTCICPYERLKGSNNKLSKS